MLQLAASGGASCVREDGAGYHSDPGPDRLPSLTDSGLLEARFSSDEPREQAQALQDALRQLGTAQAHIELSLGEGLGLLRKGRFDIAELGHSHFAGLCHGRYGFSGAHGRELRSLHARLDGLPLLRAAFLAGLIPRTHIRTVLGIATTNDEAAWARLAMQLSSRELQLRVTSVKAARQARDGGACGSPDDETEADETERVSWLGTRADRAAWEFLLVAIRQVLGKQASLAECAEVLAAETLADSPPIEPDGGACALADAQPDGGRQASQSKRTPVQGHAPRQTRRVFRRLLRALARAEERKPLGPAALALPETPDFSTCGSATDVHDMLTPLVARRNAIERERGKLLAWMQGRCLYRSLGFPNFHAWLERALGMGPRDAHRLIELQGRAEFLPSLDAAWASGTLSTHQVWRVAQVAERTTVGEWIHFAGEVTPKHLDAAVMNSVVRADLVGTQRACGLPPWDQPHGALLLDWQTQLGVRERKAMNDAGGACARDDGQDDGPNLDEAFRAQAGGLSRCRIGFRAPPAVARMFRRALAAARAGFGAPISDAEAVRLMARNFLAVHVNAEVLAHARRHAIMERDGWCCVIPHCQSRGPLHAHHVRFRSRGGGDEASNLASVCEACHALIHAGKILMFGRAPGTLTVLMGTRREAYSGERRLAADEGWGFWG